jgi:ferredoxin
MMLRLKHKRDDCIGCDSCACDAPGYWEMAEDGMASLIRRTETHGVFEFAEAFEDDREMLEEVASACPVDIISVEEKSAGSNRR